MTEYDRLCLPFDESHERTASAIGTGLPRALTRPRNDGVWLSVVAQMRVDCRVVRFQRTPRNDGKINKSYIAHTFTPEQ